MKDLFLNTGLIESVYIFWEQVSFIRFKGGKIPVRNARRQKILRPAIDLKRKSSKMGLVNPKKKI